MAPEVDEELEELEIQRELEEARADAIANGMRLIERYYYRIPVEKDQFSDRAWMAEHVDMAKEVVAVLFEGEGYKATEEPVVRVDQHMFGGEVVNLPDGTEIVYVAQIVATIRGFKP